MDGEESFSAVALMVPSDNLVANGTISGKAHIAALEFGAEIVVTDSAIHSIMASVSLLPTRVAGEPEEQPLQGRPRLARRLESLLVVQGAPEQWSQSIVTPSRIPSRILSLRLNFNKHECSP